MRDASSIFYYALIITTLALSFGLLDAQAATPELEKMYFGGGRWWQDGDTMRHSWGVGRFIARFTGSSSLVIRMGAGYDGAYYTCRVNDGPETRMLVANSFYAPAANGMTFTGLSAAEEYIITCGRNNEASFGDTIVSGVTLESGGKLLQAEDPNSDNTMIRFEAIGDSITAGYNVLTPPGVSEPMTTANQDVFQTYIRFMADAWGTTDYRVIAKSGVSVLDYNAATGVVMPLEWPCREYWDGWEGSCPAPWNFDEWQADVVTINLGTNDFVYGDPTQQEFREGYLSFIEQVRAKYPNALIACIEPIQHSCNGENYPSLTGIVNGLEQAVNDINDPRVIYYETGDTADPWLDCTLSTQDFVDFTHPTVQGNRKFAAKLLEKMEDDVNRFFPNKVKSPVVSSPPVTSPTSSPVTVSPPASAPAPTSARCGCEKCTEDVWSTLANGYTCGSRIGWVRDADQDTLISVGVTTWPMDEAEACRIVSYEFPDICTCFCDDEDDDDDETTTSPTSTPTVSPTTAPTVSPTIAPTDSPTTTAQTDSPTNEPTDSVTTAQTTNSPTPAPTDDDLTASPTSSSEDPDTTDFRCGCSDCIQKIWDADADGYTCGFRIQWLQTPQATIVGGPYDEVTSCRQVSEEFPEECGRFCHPETCSSTSLDRRKSVRRKLLRHRQRGGTKKP